MIEIGAFIKELRNNFGLTQEQLSEKVGCTVAHLGRIEINAANPSIEFLEKLFIALDIPPSNLLAKLSGHAKDSQRNQIITNIHKELLGLGLSDLKWILKIVQTTKERNSEA